MSSGKLRGEGWKYMNICRGQLISISYKEIKAFETFSLVFFEGEVVTLNILECLY